MKRFLRRAGIALVVIAAALWLNNTSLFVPRSTDQTAQLIAHRGVHQIYAGTDRVADTCSSNLVQPLTHQFIANTLPSMEAAFAAGAQVVEIDVHLTTDGIFAVFHDWTLDCQTDGTGVTHEQEFAYLRSLDLGYGITEGDGEFPLRGSAEPMPSLLEVFEADLGGRYLINFKSNRAEEGVALAVFLEKTGFGDQIWGVYGGSPPVQTAIDNWDGLRGFGRAELKACLFDYLKIGWSGIVPESCHNRIIAVPMDYGPWLWGWPHKFTQRMNAVGTEVILWGPYDGSGFSSGVDDAQMLSQVPAQFDGFIWTNRILDIAPLLEAQTRP